MLRWLKQLELSGAALGFLLTASLFCAQCLSSFDWTLHKIDDNKKEFRTDGSRLDPMDVVLIADMSGKNKSIGSDIAAGFQEAVKTSNLDLWVRLVVRDTQGRREATAALAQGAATGNRTLAMVGPTETDGMFDIAEAANEGEVLALSPLGVPNNFKPGQWFFSLQQSNFKQGQVLGHFIQRLAAGSRVGRFISERAEPDSLWEGLISSYRSIGSKTLELNTWKSNQSPEEARNTISNSSYLDAIILSLPAAEAEVAVRMLRSVSFEGLVIIEGEASLGAFPTRFQNDPKEAIRPGYFTDGLIAPVPFVPTITGELGQRLISTYGAGTNKTPTWAYAYGYDAGLLIARFVQTSLGTDTYDLSKPDKLRTLLRRFILSQSSLANAVTGFSGPIHFDAEHQRNIPPKFVYYKNRVEVPYFEQISEQPTIRMVGTKVTEAIQVGDEIFQVVPVVYTGLAVQRIDNVDLNGGTVSLTFDFSLRSRRLFELGDIQFENQIGEFKLVEKREEILGTGSIFRRYRISGDFQLKHRAADLALGKTMITLRWRHRSLDSDNLQFVVDPDYRVSTAIPIEKQAPRAGSLNAFNLTSYRLAVENQTVFAPGDPRGIAGNIKYSTAAFQGDLQREFSNYTSFLMAAIGQKGVKYGFASASVLFAVLAFIRCWARSATLAVLAWVIIIPLFGLSQAALFLSPALDASSLSTIYNLALFYDFLITFAMIRIMDLVIIYFVRLRSKVRDTQPVVVFLIRFVVYFLGFSSFYTIVLARDLLPVLATFSVLLTVFGLALRDLIFDMIAGIAIAGDGNLTTGQYISVRARERTIQGAVVSFGWRYILVRSRDDQVHFIPNSVLATQILSNMSMLRGFMRIEVPFIMAADADADAVIAIVTAAVEDEIANDKNVDHSRSVRIIISSLEAEKLGCIVQIFYEAKQSADSLRSRVLRVVRDTLAREGGLSRQRDGLP
jgi:small-conductance mechanosensitive channel/ABC-type branched-subunit amino acid transport system substrate-binding protein